MREEISISDKKKKQKKSLKVSLVTDDYEHLWVKTKTERIKKKWSRNCFFVFSP